MNRIVLTVEKRLATGKGPARRLRAEGKTPAIFYGRKTEPIQLAVAIHEFQKLVEEAGSNPVFDLRFQDDDASTVSRSAVLKERQVNPMDGTIVHMDFIAISMDEAIEVTVPLEFTGEAEGVKNGGFFQVVARDMRISCLPGDIPNVITVDVSGLDIGHSIHMGEVSLPEGVTAVQDPAIAIATVIPPEAEKAPAEPAA